MSKIKYILTKYETIIRTEKVKYTVEIPKNIRRKAEYAEEQVLHSNYVDYKIVDIIDSEMLDDGIYSLRKIQ